MSSTQCVTDVYCRACTGVTDVYCRACTGVTDVYCRACTGVTDVYCRACTGCAAVAVLAVSEARTVSEVRAAAAVLAVSEARTVSEVRAAAAVRAAKGQCPLSSHNSSRCSLAAALPASLETWAHLAGSLHGAVHICSRHAGAKAPILSIRPRRRKF
ncbi:hypothetical protein FHG87_023242 [Trinorchestia longiramus]|nr:hypothetical protein FHG87_023242 [Trinorchestia longiramus]